MKLSNIGFYLLKEFEQGPGGGPALTPYLDSAGVLTIGYGSTGDHVKRGMKISRVEAEELLIRDVARFERDVTNLLSVTVSQNQFDALVCFAFNVGSDIDKDTIAEGLGDSTLLKKVNNREFNSAANEFLKWDKATVNGQKVVLNGLVRRRKSERALFLGLDWKRGELMNE